MPKRTLPPRTSKAVGEEKRRKMDEEIDKLFFEKSPVKTGRWAPPLPKDDSSIDELKKILQEIQDNERLAQVQKIDMSHLKQYIKQHGLPDLFTLLFMCGYVCSLPLSTREKFFDCLFECLDDICMSSGITDIDKRQAILKKIATIREKKKTFESLLPSFSALLSSPEITSFVNGECQADEEQENHAMVLDTIDLTEDTDEDTDEDPDEHTDKDIPIENAKDDDYEDDDGIVWYGWKPSPQQKDLDDDINDIENGSDDGDINMDVLLSEIQKIGDNDNCDNQDGDLDEMLEESAKN